jgi:hypothetical protein
MKNYRKLYEKYHNCCLLPGIDIHHVDGNHQNNSIENLKAVSLEEHYNIHKSQNEFYAAYLIGKRMKIKPDDWKLMAKINGAISGKSNYNKGIGLKGWINSLSQEDFKKHCSESGKLGGITSLENQSGFHSATTEQKKKWASQGGKASPGFKLGHASQAGKVGGEKGGKYAKENRTGIFALSPEQDRLRIQNMQTTWAIKLGKASAWPRTDYETI